MSSPIIGVLFFFILACAISGGIILLFRAIDKSKPEIEDYGCDDDFDLFDDVVDRLFVDDEYDDEFWDDDFDDKFCNEEYDYE